MLIADSVRCKLSEQNFENFENFTIRGRFFEKTRQLLTKFPGLASLKHDNSTMITGRWKWSLYGMSSLDFYR